MNAICKKFNDEHKVFHAEIVAVTKAASLLMDKGIRQRSIVMIIDIQAAIKAIASMRT